MTIFEKNLEEDYQPGLDFDVVRRGIMNVNLPHDRFPDTIDLSSLTATQLDYFELEDYPDDNDESRIEFLIAFENSDVWDNKYTIPVPDMENAFLTELRVLSNQDGNLIRIIMAVYTPGEFNTLRNDIHYLSSESYNIILPEWLRYKVGKIVRDKMATRTEEPVVEEAVDYQPTILPGIDETYYESLIPDTLDLSGIRQEQVERIRYHDDGMKEQFVCFVLPWRNNKIMVDNIKISEIIIKKDMSSYVWVGVPFGEDETEYKTYRILSNTHMQLGESFDTVRNIILPGWMKYRAKMIYADHGETVVEEAVQFGLELPMHGGTNPTVNPHSKSKKYPDTIDLSDIPMDRLKAITTYVSAYTRPERPLFDVLLLLKKTEIPNSDGAFITDIEFTMKNNEVLFNTITAYSGKETLEISLPDFLSGDEFHIIYPDWMLHRAKSEARKKELGI